MAAKKGRGGPRQQVKGFRPGKEPVQLKRQRAKAQLGSDAGWVQKQTVDAIAGRSPAEVERMVRRWSMGFSAGGGVLVLAGAVLYGWSWIAGALVHVVAAVLLFLAYRVRKQGPGLADIARSLR